MTFTDADKTEILRDAYKKNAAELLAIEEAQQKFIALLVGVLGAGGSFLAGVKTSPTAGARWGLTGLAVAVVVVGLVTTDHRDNARKDTRELLVRCERALRFYDVGAFAADTSLYDPKLQTSFPTTGDWLGRTVILVVLVAGAYVAVVWSM